ncbi:hypothetical protein F4805DRAFT_427713 [Annulohypoxylon moriforme]|nr:hypothetical protein F4805DRAFT_427713 [Annulohypoxylon moriforme]
MRMFFSSLCCVADTHGMVCRIAWIYYKELTTWSRSTTKRGTGRPERKVPNTLSQRPSRSGTAHVTRCYVPFLFLTHARPKRWNPTRSRNKIERKRIK